MSKIVCGVFFVVARLKKEVWSFPNTWETHREEDLWQPEVNVFSPSIGRIPSSFLFKTFVCTRNSADLGFLGIYHVAPWKSGSQRENVWQEEILQAICKSVAIIYQRTNKICYPSIAHWTSVNIKIMWAFCFWILKIPFFFSSLFESI